MTNLANYSGDSKNIKLSCLNIWLTEAKCEYER